MKTHPKIQLMQGSGKRLKIVQNKANAIFFFGAKMKRQKKSTKSPI